MAIDRESSVSGIFRENHSRSFKSLDRGEKDMARLFIMMSILSDSKRIEQAGLAEEVTGFFGLDSFDDFKIWQRSVRASGKTPEQIAENIDFSKFDFQGTENALLDLIANAEHSLPGGNYNTVFGNKQVNLTSMTINEVLAWQRDYVNDGSLSSAAGRYQIIRNTLVGLRDEMELTGNELFDEDMQDKMATALLERRGYSAFLEGDISEARFMKNLSQEWASLPKDMGGASYYAGDGLNKALVSPATVLAAARHAREQHENAQTLAQNPPAQETGLAASFTDADQGLALENAPDPHKDLSKDPEGPAKNLV